MRCVVLAFLGFLILGVGTARGQALSLIGDDETERVLSSFVVPLFEKAGLNPAALRIHLVRDDTVNAFAAKGSHIFIHTGLLLKADNAQEVIAVLAHETGHIAGGHILRLYENMRIANRNMLVATLLSAVAAAASGRPDVALAGAVGGSGSAQGLLAGYRRGEENAADQTAVDLLVKTGHDLSGFESIMRKTKAETDYQAGDDFSIYQSHPAVRERLAFILNQRKDLKTRPDTRRIKAENAAFERIRAKLYGFIRSPEKTKKRYPDTDKTVSARYARAIACFVQGEFKKAIEGLDALIAEYPDNPYFYELKGQILFETGQGGKAADPYAQAVRLLPDSVTLRVGLAQALIEKDTPDSLIEAEKTLAKFNTDTDEYPLVWRMKAIVYGRTGRQGMAAYALAEYNAAAGNMKMAEGFATRAIPLLPEGSPAQIRAEDILENARAANQKSKKI